MYIENLGGRISKFMKIFLWPVPSAPNMPSNRSGRVIGNVIGVLRGYPNKIG